MDPKATECRQKDPAKNQTQKLPPCGAVPQPTAPSTPLTVITFISNTFVYSHLIYSFYSRYPIKSKGVPRQAEVAQGVSGRLRPWIIVRFRHYKGGRTSAKCTGRLYPRRNPWYSLSEAQSTSGHMVLLGVPRKKSPVTLPGINPGTVGLVVQCLNHYATPGPQIPHYCHSIQRFLSFNIQTSLIPNNNLSVKISCS